MTPKQQLLHRVSKRLLTCLGTVVIVTVAAVVTTQWRITVYKDDAQGLGALTPFAALMIGAIGGFVSLQRRLKQLDEDDLTLIAESWIYTALSPFVGGVLALLLYFIFMSGLLSGQLFPQFDAPADGARGFVSIFSASGSCQDYAKLIFWSFVAGYSERFVIDIISQFQSKNDDHDNGPKNE